jgi:pectate lyase
MFRTSIVLLVFVAMTIRAENTIGAEGPAFAGAVGFGVDTPGGRGGQILRVTNLDASGPGSLRAALEAKGPRIVVFEVGGVIDLNRDGLVIDEPFVTVAGQTAPSPGITVTRGGISILAQDVVIRHLRVRPGDAGQAKRSGWEPDGIATNAAHHVVIDHCSVTWAVDENISASGPRHEGPEKTSHDITFSNCIIAEGLNDSSHQKGPHSKGSLIHDYCARIAILNNLYAHNVERNPYFKAFTTGVVVNNVIYNPGRRAIKVTYSDGEWRDRPVRPQNARIAVVGNVMIKGVDTRVDAALVGERGDVYLRDNIASNADGSPAPKTAGKVVMLDKAPVWPKGLEPLPADRIADHVVKHVGARPKDRDTIDRRIIRDFLKRGGRIIDSQEEVGGYPESRMTQRQLRIPSEGVEAWLDKMAAELE